jgi:glycosyltransferase involved in cell wall biosynthesis
MKRLRILGLCSYPVEAAATRYRLAQFVEPLKDKGIDLELSPFLSSGQFKSLYGRGSTFEKFAGMPSSILKRILEVFKARNYDIILVQREAMIFGPAFFETLMKSFGRAQMVLDLDDATYVSYVSPTYGRIASRLKFFGKTDNLIRRSDLVICGNRFIAEHVDRLGTDSFVIPTVVDGRQFYPSETENRRPVVGWIGTHSTFPFVRALIPVLQELARKHDFKVRLVGTGEDTMKIEGLEIENLEWSMKREVKDFQSLDIGLYPMNLVGAATAEWLAGKSGFKAIQYMAVGIPFVMTPIGVCAEIGSAGKTHLNAETDSDWYNSLDKLLTNEELRKTMGEEGRACFLRDYDLHAVIDRFEQALRSVVT